MKNDLEILVVDDEENVCFVLDQLLSAEGYKVTSAQTGERAMERYSAVHYPLVIVDIRLPGMSGLQLLEQIKQVNPDAQVIVITGHAQFDYAAKALSAGAYELLLKPFDNLDLVTATVARAVEKIGVIEENKELVRRLDEEKAKLTEINQSLAELSIRDGLTGLFNYRHIQACLDTEVARARRHGKSFSVLFIDIDNFKRYNDEYGHADGDLLLRDFAELLSKNMRESDLAARYGGEEFLVLLPETHKGAARTMADEILGKLTQHSLGGRGVNTGASIGIACYPDDGDESAKIVRAADGAMYQAKAAGGNRVVVAGA